MPEATVLIPTFDHGPLIRHALASAQGQTLRDIEIFVVGDGAPAVTREIVERAAAGDPRIRYFENPKGERHGERHRHRALGEATGRIVCYLSDDDLWFPDHVATMAELLTEADFAGGMQGRFHPDGWIYGQACNLALRQYRSPKTKLGIKLGLSSGAHTLAFYRRLPEGWRPAPPDVFTDQYMWRQILRHAGLPCRQQLPADRHRFQLHAPHAHVARGTRARDRTLGSGDRRSGAAATLARGDSCRQPQGRDWDANYYAERRGLRARRPLPSRRQPHVAPFLPVAARAGRHAGGPVSGGGPERPATRPSMRQSRRESC